MLSSTASFSAFPPSKILWSVVTLSCWFCYIFYKSVIISANSVYPSQALSSQQSFSKLDFSTHTTLSHALSHLLFFELNFIKLLATLCPFFGGIAERLSAMLAHSYLLCFGHARLTSRSWTGSTSWSWGLGLHVARTVTSLRTVTKFSPF